MKPEDYLDYLIEQRENGIRQPLLSADDVAESLAAAEHLVQMRKIPVPSDFALRLEEKVRVHARALQSSEQSGRLLPSGQTQRYRPPQRSLKHRAWVFTLGAAAVLLIVFASLLTVSGQSLPGDPLYSLKQTEDQITLNLANNAQSRANEALGHLQNALTDLNIVVRGKRGDDAIQQALNTVAVWTASSQTAVAALPAASHPQATQQLLAAKLASEKQMLYRLLDQVDWSMKVAFTQQLGALDEVVPVVTRVVVQTQGNGIVQITLTGDHFSSQAQFVIDGKLVGNISLDTATDLVVVVVNTWWTSGTHTIGVLNPGGTAAQMVYQANDDGYEQTGTPAATPTRRAHKDD